MLPEIVVKSVDVRKGFLESHLIIRMLVPSLKVKDGSGRTLVLANM